MRTHGCTVFQANLLGGRTVSRLSPRVQGWFMTVICLLAMPAWGVSQSKCSYLERDTLAWMDGSAESLLGWHLLDPAEGGSWQVDEGDLVGMMNPGAGSWVYVSESEEDDIGQAILLSPVFERSAEMSDLTLQFLLALATYEGAGRCVVDLHDGGDWIQIFELDEDYYGKVEIPLGRYAGKLVQLRFRFDDEGKWSWGMGLDEILLTGRPGFCGDGICEEGDACPEDCPPQNDAPAWISLGEDLKGEKVTYKKFARGDACDDCSEALPLGFNFAFFEKNYQQVFINSNGNISLDAPHYEFTPEPFCQNGPRMVAPFFGDVDLSKGGEIWYYLDPHKHYLIVTWLEVGYYGCEGNDCATRNSFQVLLTDGSVREVRGQLLPTEVNVLFSYGKMGWTTGGSSGGIRGFGGFPATVGINFGDGQQCHDYGTFNRPGRAYYGNSQDDGCPANEVGYLEGKSLWVNAKEGKMVAPTLVLDLKGNTQPEGDWLSWQTNQPATFDYFVLEGGEDTLSPRELATYSPGSDPTLNPQPQGFEGSFRMMVPPEDRTQWYRVTGVTHEGDWTYSDWVRLGKVAASAHFQLLTLFPNPFQEEPLTVSIDMLSAGNIQWELTNMAGTRVGQGRWELPAGRIDRQVNVPPLPAGRYVFTLRYQDHVQFRYLLKQ